MRPSSFALLAAAGVALIACETYKADASPGAKDNPTVAADQAGGETAPPPPAADEPAPAAAESGPSCDEVVDHLVAMTKKELAGLSEEERTQAAAVLPAVKAQVSDACSSSNWSAEFKQCILGATDEEGLRACEKYGPEHEPEPAVAKAPADKAEPAANAEPAAADESGSECEGVVDHLIEVALSAPDIPEAQRAQMKAVMPQQKGLMLKACKSTPWPAPLRKCLLEAKNGADIQGCRSFATP